jgi:hypothetical protein
MGLEAGTGPTRSRAMARTSLFRSKVFFFRAMAPLFFRRRKTGYLRRTHHVELQQLAADVFADALRLLVGFVFDLKLQKKVAATHIPYTKRMACAICEVRRPRRHCPGVRGDICSICCGTEREVTVECPFDCVHLQEARLREKGAEIDPANLPNQDIRFTESFLRDNEALLVVLAQALLGTAVETPGVVDADVRETLDALIRTYRTLQSGVYYETRPSNPLANFLCNGVQQAAAAFREREREQAGMSKTRDADVLGVLAFLQRLELDRNNGRRRGRAFLDFLRVQFGSPETASAAPLILP